MLFLCCLLTSGVSIQDALSNDYFCSLTVQNKKKLLETAYKVIELRKAYPNLDTDEVLEMLRDEQVEVDLYQELIRRDVIQILDSASTTETDGRPCGVIGT